MTDNRQWEQIITCIRAVRGAGLHASLVVLCAQIIVRIRLRFRFMEIEVHVTFALLKKNKQTRRTWLVLVGVNARNAPS